MATKRQIEANRRNAQRSTGPKTKTGKATSSRNAFIHGLACSRESADDIHQLVHAMRELNRAITADEAIAGDEVIQIARFNDDLQRIRRVRYSMLSALLEAPHQSRARQIANLQRYERTAFTKRRRLLQSYPYGQPIDRW